MSNSVNIWYVIWLMAFLIGGVNQVRGQCPNPNQILGANEVCPGSTTDYVVTNDNSATNTYAWALSGGGQIIGSTTGISVTIEWQNTNGGPFTLMCTERNGFCYQENLLTVYIADDYIRYPFNCFSEVNIPFDAQCEKLILPEHLLRQGIPDCPNAFEVLLTLDGTQFVPNPVPIDYIDQVITATIVHRESRTTCQTLLTLQDGTAPIIACQNDTILCSDPLAWDPFHNSFNKPLVTDNCQGVLEPIPNGFEWINLFTDSIYSSLILRTWMAEDKYNNTSFCTDTLFLRRVIFDSIQCPQDTIMLCDDPLFDLSDPLTSGVPTFDGLPLWTERHYCEFLIDFTDRIAYACQGNYTITRTWLIKQLDGPVFDQDTCVQTIQVIDTTGPDISFDHPDISLQSHADVSGINPDSLYKTIAYPTLEFGCVAHGYFPTPIIQDNCSSLDSIVVDIEWSLGHIQYKAHEDEHLFFKDLPAGKHRITLKARDACHNISYDTLIVITEDRKPPYMVANKNPVVALASYADVTWIDVSVFDEGTWDNCELYLILGRRVDWDTVCGFYLDREDDHPIRNHYDNFWEWLNNDLNSLCMDSIGYGWTDQIPFCCDDACGDEPVIVELLGIDANCNVGRIWVEVKVEDKTRPEVKYKLPDLDISCRAYNDYYREHVESGDLSVFGTYFDSHDSVHATFTIKDRLCSEMLDEHGDYYTWVENEINQGVVYDNCGVQYTEHHISHFEHCGIGWIERYFEFTGICNVEKADTLKVIQRINIYNDCPLHESEIIWPVKDTTIYDCGWVDVETEAPRMKFDDACRSIGIHHKDQVLEVIGGDSTCIKIIRKWAVIDWCRQTEPYHEEWIGDQNFHYYEYDQIIHIKNKNGPEISGCEIDTLCIGSDCTHNLETTITVTDDCTPSEDIEVTWTLFEKSEYGYYPMESGSTSTASAIGLPMGTYKLIWEARDKCNNETYCTDYFEVVDCIKPTPICFSEITVKLLPIDKDQNGVIDTAIGVIWASELDVSSYDNCQAKLTDFRIRWKGQMVNEIPPDPSETKLEVGCVDVGKRTVEFWVIDQWGNADFCETVINVQGPIEGCSGAVGSINGNILNIAGKGIPDVLVSLQQEEYLVEETFTDAKGNYAFDHRISSGIYDLTPSKFDDPIKGITTFDLIKISKHLLGKKDLGSPLLYKAADANGDGYVSVRDIIILRKLILGKIDDLPMSKLWYFFNIEQDSSSEISINEQYRDYLSFSGIKVGDLNGDAVSSPDENRNAKEPYMIHLPDVFWENRTTFEIPVIASRPGIWEGLQISFRVDPSRVSINKIVGKKAQISNDNITVAADWAGISWVAPEQWRIQKGDTLFVMTVETINQGRISESIALNANRLSSEIYSTSDDIYPIRIQFISAGSKIESIQLSQNYPNPFKDQTRFDLYLPVADQITWSIIDLSGKKLHQESMFLGKGYHTITLNESLFGMEGIYMYQISTSYDQQSRRIVFTD